MKKNESSWDRFWVFFVVPSLVGIWIGMNIRSCKLDELEARIQAVERTEAE